MADEKKKLCPKGRNRSTMDEGTAFCEQEKCQWWILRAGTGTNIDNCAIVVIAESLFSLADK